MKEQTKLTFRVDQDLYEDVKKKFHYGQLNALWRSVFYAIVTLVASDKGPQIYDFMYKGKDLLLPAKKARKEKI